MSDITYTDKIAGSSFTHENANEIKTAVNSKVDKETGKVLSDNNYTDADVSKLDGIEAGAQVNAANTVVDASYVHTDNNFNNTYKGNLDKVTIPSTGTLTTGSNALDLTTLIGKEYAPYDMASGALTLTAAASPIRGGCAYGIIISDATTTPNVTAFTVLTGEYDNTNNVENHFIVVRKLNASNEETNYLQWIQPV